MLCNAKHYLQFAFTPGRLARYSPNQLTAWALSIGACVAVLFTLPHVARIVWLAGNKEGGPSLHHLDAIHAWTRAARLRESNAVANTRFKKKKELRSSVYILPLLRIHTHKPVSLFTFIA